MARRRRDECTDPSLICIGTCCSLMRVPRARPLVYRSVRPDPECARRFADHWPGSPAKVLLRSLEATAIRQLELRPRRLLDLGCGDGVFSRVVFPDAEIWGIEVSAERARLASERLDCVACVPSGSPSPFEGVDFDVLLCNSVLEHTPDPSSVLSSALTASCRQAGTEAIVTVPLDAKKPNLYFTQVVPGYPDRFDRQWGHLHMCSSAWWIDTLTRPGSGWRYQAGFEFEGQYQTAAIDLMREGPFPAETAPSERASEILAELLPAIAAVGEGQPQSGGSAALLRLNAF